MFKKFFNKSLATVSEISPTVLEIDITKLGLTSETVAPKLIEALDNNNYSLANSLLNWLIKHPKEGIKPWTDHTENFTLIGDILYKVANSNNFPNSSQFIFIVKVHSEKTTDYAINFAIESDNHEKAKHIIKINVPLVTKDWNMLITPSDKLKYENEITTINLLNNQIKKIAQEKYYARKLEEHDEQKDNNPKIKKLLELDYELSFKVEDRNYNKIKLLVDELLYSPRKGLSFLQDENMPLAANIIYKLADLAPSDINAAKLIYEIKYNFPEAGKQAINLAINDYNMDAAKYIISIGVTHPTTHISFYYKPINRPINWLPKDEVEKSLKKAIQDNQEQTRKEMNQYYEKKLAQKELTTISQNIDVKVLEKENTNLGGDFNDLSDSSDI